MGETYTKNMCIMVRKDTLDESGHSMIYCELAVLLMAAEKRRISHMCSIEVGIAAPEECCVF